jgi:NADPH:quinone reductase-like Zn-dependent oxidoreductase
MKAVITPHYGEPEVLYFAEVNKPEIAPDEILIQVKSVTVTSGDIRLRGGIFPAGLGLIAKIMAGFRGPREKIQGVDFAGDVVDVGAEVTKFQVGDRVFGLDGSKAGGYAEFKKAKQDIAIAKIPTGMSYADAVALAFGGSTALHFLNHAIELEESDCVLINGASGAVGSMGVQIASHFGADVIGVCSGKNSKLVKSLGAKDVIDYTKQSLVDLDQKFDYIVDTVGNLKISEISHLLTEKGKFIVVSGDLSALIAPLHNKKVIGGVASEKQSDMELLATLAKEGAITPIIDKTYPFTDIVEAHKYVQAGHKVGNVVLDWN